MVRDRIERATDEAIDRAAEILRGGGLVAFPTETVYGLGARALDAAALLRVFAVKGRPVTHPLIAHLLDVDAARPLAAAWPDAAEHLARAFWPGPLTLVVPRARHVPSELSGGGDSVALRAPSHPVARALLRALGEPIAAPSANRYQSISPTTALHVAESLGDAVDLILDGGPCTAGIESTVVDVRAREPIILRLGALDLPTLRTIVPELCDAAPGPHVAEGATRPSPGMDRRHYAPKTPLVVAVTRSALLEEARHRCGRGERVGLLLMTPPEAPLDRATAIALGSRPDVYARGLYAALHDLDALRALSVILVEPVPVTPEWRAIEDRLRRAGTDFAPVMRRSLP